MKRINIEIPMRLCEYAIMAATSWKLTYIGRDNAGTYHYTLADKEDDRIKIGVEIRSELEPSYNPLLWYVKIYCTDLNVPLKRGYTKLMRVDEFKNIKWAFNTLFAAGMQLLQ